MPQEEKAPCSQTPCAPAKGRLEQPLILQPEQGKVLLAKGQALSLPAPRSSLAIAQTQLLDPPYPWNLLDVC